MLLKGLSGYPIVSLRSRVVISTRPWLAEPPSSAGGRRHAHHESIDESVNQGRVVSKGSRWDRCWP